MTSRKKTFRSVLDKSRINFTTKIKFNQPTQKTQMNTRAQQSRKLNTSKQHTNQENTKKKSPLNPSSV